MNFIEKLRASAQKTGSIVCMGIDPVIEAIPVRFRERHSEENGPEVILPYFLEIFRQMNEKRVQPGAFKLNPGFFERHDVPAEGYHGGTDALEGVISGLRRLFPAVPIILDFKRGDIGPSSENYAKVGFNRGVDAVTVHPYMGTDSVQPFVLLCNDHDGMGAYILNRTSNQGAGDFQDLQVVAGDGATKPLYMVVAGKIVEWARGHPGVGAVVGATSPQELSELASFYAGKEIPLLIPGVGGQGGDAGQVAQVLRVASYDLSIVRINSSSGITHPWVKKKNPAPEDFSTVCVAELMRLNRQIGYEP